MKVKITGIQLKIIACVGSGGVGLSFICAHMVTPMIAPGADVRRPNIGSVVRSNGIGRTG